MQYQVKILNLQQQSVEWCGAGSDSCRPGSVQLENLFETGLAKKINPFYYLTRKNHSKAD